MKMTETREKEPTKEAQTIQLLVADTLIDKQGNLKIAEIQPFGSSRGDKKSVKELLKILSRHNVSQFIIPHNAQCYPKSGFDSDEIRNQFPEIQAKRFYGIQRTDEKELTEIKENSLALLQEDTWQFTKEVLQSKIKYIENSEMGGSPKMLLMGNKFLERYFLQKYCRELNPENWTLYNRKNLPNLDDLNNKENYLNGYILKPTTGALSKNVTTKKFETKEELEAYLKENNIKNFLIESFIPAEKKLKRGLFSQARSFQTVDRVFYLLVEGEMHPLAVRIRPANQPLNERQNFDDNNVCTHGTESFTPKQYKKKFGEKNSPINQDNMNKIQKLLEQLHSMDDTKIYELFTEILQSDDSVHQQYMLDIIAHFPMAYMTNTPFPGPSEAFQQFIKNLLSQERTNTLLQEDFRNREKNKEYTYSMKTIRMLQNINENRTEEIISSELKKTVGFLNEDYDELLNNKLNSLSVANRDFLFETDYINQNEYIINHDGSKYYINWKDQNNQLRYVYSTDPFEIEWTIISHNLTPFDIKEFLQAAKPELKK